MDDSWVPIVMFAAIAVVLSLFFYYRMRSRRHLQETLQTAIEKGQELSPEIIDRLAGPKPHPHHDLRRGVIALGLAAGVAGFGLVLGEEDALRPMLAIATVPGLIGVAYLVLWKIGDSPEAATG